MVIILVSNVSNLALIDGVIINVRYLNYILMNNSNLNFKIRIICNFF